MSPDRVVEVLCNVVLALGEVKSYGRTYKLHDIETLAAQYGRGSNVTKLEVREVLCYTPLYLKLDMRPT